ncbi:hypothetical protein C0991_006543 [Blastosporella zonata]|nr:hypothetical protein C0991_006543 [Blastosporella zonata]
MDRQIHGHSLKARLNSQDDVGAALETCYHDLKANMGKERDLDQAITISHLPDHLQLLIQLSNPPSNLTEHHASSILYNRANPSPPPSTLTWASIVAEEPFEGEHWQGVYGLPPGFVRANETQPKGFYDREKESERLDWDSRWSTPSLSPLNSDDLELDADQEEEQRALASSGSSSSSHSTHVDGPENAGGTRSADVYGEAAPRKLSPQTYAHRKEFERLQAKQYWREGWKGDVNPLEMRAFDMGDASTLGPTLRRVLQPGNNVADASLTASLDALVQNERYINEEDAVREVLIALQGLDNILFQWKERNDDNPIATFTQTFAVLLDIVDTVYPEPDSSSSASTPSTSSWVRRSVAAASADLLDHLFASIQAHLERHEQTTAAALLRVFVNSAEPIWGMMGKWLRDGMGLGVAVGPGDSTSMWELDEEFFIESGGLGVGLGLLDPEYWKEGYALREGVVSVDDDDEEGYGSERRQKTIPQFLEHVAEPVLSAGKSAGLLRALGVPLSSIEVEDGGAGEWRSFKELVDFASNVGKVGFDRKEPGDMLFSVSIDTLSRMIYDRLLPRCDAVGALLAQVLVEDCALWTHLSSIEGLFLMQRGDAMSHFTDVLFAKMDAQQSWGDFHFLNTAFRDVVDASVNVGAKVWIQPPLVRLSYRGGKDKDRSIARTVKAFDGLAVEYAVPFPLTYIFQPMTLQVYGEIFVLLLQIRRAKGVLERILVRGEARAERLRNELKGFYAMRSRLSWFINSDDDDDDYVGGAADVPESSFSLNTSVSYVEEGFQTRMDKMTSELDGLVRFLRRGVESLAGGTGEAAPAYGVLAFALEDWDT